MSLLYTKTLRKEFGGVVAVRDVDFLLMRNLLQDVLAQTALGKRPYLIILQGLTVRQAALFFLKGIILQSYLLTKLPDWKLQGHFKILDSLKR